MIIDCCIFSNEKDILNLRLNILKNDVDYFLVVESDKVHLTGEKRELQFEKLFSDHPLRDRILYFPIELTEYTNWGRENENRYKIFDCLKKININGKNPLSDDDLILVSDCDEIPNPKMIYLAHEHNFCYFDQMYFVYYLNCYSGKNVTGTSACKYKFLNDLEARYTQSCQWLRNYKDYGFEILNGGWHYSYMGGIDFVLKKSHSIAEGNTSYSREFFEKQFDDASKKLVCPYSSEELQYIDVYHHNSYINGIRLRHGEKISFRQCYHDIIPKEVLRNTHEYRHLIYA